MLKEAWTLAIETLSWMEIRKLSERLALAKTVKQLGMRNPDAIRLAHRLVCETVRRQNFIDQFVNSALTLKAISEFQLGVQAFLRLYVYQTRIAKNWSRINIGEAENIAKLARSILGWRTIQKVEHVLGLLLTQKPNSVLEGVSDEEKVGLSTFHPTWFVRYCFRLLGRKEAIAMLKASAKSPPTYIRLNTLKASETEILRKLWEEGIKTEKVEALKYAYEVISAKQPLTKTESFRKGLFYIQDKASCFTVEVANAKPEMIIFDVCAAPGAKTTYLAQLMQNRGKMYSMEYSRRRMNVWRSETARMGVKNAIPLITDACNPFPIQMKADVLILDPPCTSTGVFGKLPSAKWRITRRSVDKMAEIQWKMLNSCAGNVKPGGTLVYSTCSITIEENEMLIERFLKWHPEYSPVEITPKIGLPGLRGMGECQRLYPHIHRCNGFFIARLSKR